tara:strand:- start:333 stop:752 length:420 start_codon:yes stop_codon:yes gene_type:complete
MVIQLIKISRMKTLRSILIAMVMLVSANTIYAQGMQETLQNSTPEERAEAQTEVMKEKLELQDNQYNQVHEINLKYANKVEQLKSSSSSRRDKFNKIKSLQDEKDKEMKGALSEEQFSTYEDEKRDIMQEVKKRLSEGS